MLKVHAVVPGVLGVCLACGCAARQPLREYVATPDIFVPPVRPIPVQTEQMESVTVGRTIVDIAQGATTARAVTDGTVTREYPLPQDDFSNGLAAWSKDAVAELKHAGYPVLKADHLVFAQDDAARSRYVIGGTMKDFLCIVHSSRSEYNDPFTPLECGVEMVWQVYDTTTRQVVLTKRERGYAEIAGFYPAVNSSVRSAFRSLLADPEFVSALQKHDVNNGMAAAPVFPTMPLPAPPSVALQLPQQMQAVTDAVTVVHGRGTAFFITSGGYLLTAAHVVAGHETWLMKIGDGRQAMARVWRTDAVTDVALLRIADGSYPALQLNTTGRPHVGTEVYAVGTPLTEELERSVSRGIVSAERTSPGHDLIQTDASVNFGNSGGPLVDADGKVVGIITSKAASPGSAGIAFAVPIQLAIDRLNLNFASAPPSTQPATSPAVLPAPVK